MDFQNRQYDPQIGRFLSVDPLADDGQEEWSPYAAMGNNPAMMVDPLGLKFDMGTTPYVRLDAPGYMAGMGGKKDNSPGSKDRDGSFEAFLKLGLMGSAAVTAMEKQEMVNETYAEAMGMVYEANASNPATNDLAREATNSLTSTSDEDPQEKATQTKGNESSNPTRDKGGYIKGYSNFYKFMVDKAKNEKNEVSAVLVEHKTTQERRYFVFPWENNTPDNSSSDFSLIESDDY